MHFKNGKNMSQQTKKQLSGSTEISVTLTLEQWHKILYTIGIGSPILPKENIGGWIWEHSPKQATQERVKLIVEGNIIPQMSKYFEQDEKNR